MDILTKLFGSNNRVKLLRLFLFNPDQVLEKKEVAKRSKVTTANLRKEMKLLESIGFVKAKKIRPPKGSRRKSLNGWELNPTFPFVSHLRNLFNSDFLRRRAEIAKKFRHCGKIKLLLVAGVFLQTGDSRLDLFIVGDSLKRGLIDGAVKGIEAEVGRELVYAVLPTNDFFYRLNSSDKFIRDVFDYPHEKLVDKLAL
jgi:hypothetical protein